ncbi:calumenin-B-like isoform X2 [Hydractinia symbiolongicarpus]|uniref:calumenin-B-like isoform X2 n=1 Tax=Hydractinia symbiolongicarpus TaxID=13093 RepID=UPI00254B06A1|nr:calumenin-B-like isoform X2 [Hydractinia symbiolongicarpus]
MVRFYLILFLSIKLCLCQHESHIEQDHKAFLGTRKNEFDELSLEEAKRRLRLLVPHIDLNKDGFITAKELEIWVRDKYESLLDTDDVDAVFREADVNFDNEVTWSEYLWRHFGIRDNASDAMTSSMKEQFAPYIVRDTRRWKYADLNADNTLNENEFHMFMKPKEFSKMMSLVAQEELEAADIDNDGYVSLEEYKGSLHMPDMKRWDEKKFHEEYDLDKDGKLNVKEVELWKTPELFDRAKLEAKHLIQMADDDNDGRLSSKEIVLHHFVFVGSKATQSGQILHDEF